MILIPHMLTGAGIGRRLKSGWLAFVLGVASHYLLDMLPHWDYLQMIDLKNKTQLAEIVIDLLIGAGLVYFLTRKKMAGQGLIIWFGVLGAVFPDFLQLVYYGFGLNFTWLTIISDFHNNIHFRTELSFVGGFPATFLVILAAVAVLVL